MNRIALWFAVVLITAFVLPAAVIRGAPAPSSTREIPFTTHDGHEMLGKLTLPESASPRAVVVYVQTAEGATVDMKRHKSRTETFNYYDVYREKLGVIDVAFFSYEGRGIRMGHKPPRYEKIDWGVYNSSTLENKVRDALSAIQIVREQPGLTSTPIFLMGASESTLLAAEAASRNPKEVAGLVLYGVLAMNMRENFRYIMSDGAFLKYRIDFDLNADGRITREEFETDSKKVRARQVANAPFNAFDRDGDGKFTVEEMKVLTKKYLDAVDNDDFDTLQAWASPSAAVAVPKDWFKDHFAHKPLWSFLSALNVPVGIFHGALDINAPIEGVKKLEAEATRAGKSKMKFHYFDKLDHSLNIGEYVLSGTMPVGHAKIFEFIAEQTKRKP